MSNRMQQLIRSLELQPHVEGGFYRRTHCADPSLDVLTPAGQRPLISSIFYLLTTDSPAGHFHRNRSGILHYFHEGDPIDYHLIHGDGQYEQVTLGSRIERGDCLQLFVPGGVWKASQLTEGHAGYGLISEAVAPGFDFADMEMGTADKLKSQFPAYGDLFDALCRRV